MSKKTFEVMLVGSVMALAAQAHAAEPAGTLIGALSSCQKGFFDAVEAKHDALSKIATVQRHAGGTAFIEVTGRAKEDASFVRFSAPYQDADVPLIGYFDEVRDIGTLGKYYSWGFVVQGKVDDIAKQATPRLAEAKRVRAAEGVYVRSDLWRNGHWQDDDQLAGNTAPAPGTVERVLLIEDAGPEFSGAVRIGCSLQGSVTPAMLATERPDI